MMNLLRQMEVLSTVRRGSLMRVRVFASGFDATAVYEMSTTSAVEAFDKLLLVGAVLRWLRGDAGKRKSNQSHHISRRCRSESSAGTGNGARHLESAAIR